VTTKALYGLAALALVGLALSLRVHANAWQGVAPPKGAWALHVGIFIVWLPAILALRPLNRDVKSGDAWRVALRGAPAWTPVVLQCLTVYAVANFGLFMYQSPPRGTSPDEALVARGFSGHWLLFYGAGAAMLYSAARLRAQSAAAERVEERG